MTGFGPAKNPVVEVHVRTRAQVDFTLTIGATQEQIEVSDTGSSLQTQSAEVGLVVGSQQINDLPLNSRRYADLALLSPGVFKNPSVANAAPDRFSSNGNSETQNYFALDGVDNNSGSTNLQEGSVQNVQPPPDAIQEFRLQTRTYSTEFGTSAGAVVNASVKSGTNRFHGNAFEYARNSVLDSNTYFNRQKGIGKGVFSQNQFGGTIGGPILHDRTLLLRRLPGSSQRERRDRLFCGAIGQDEEWRFLRGESSQRPGHRPDQLHHGSQHRLSRAVSTRSAPSLPPSTLIRMIPVYRCGRARAITTLCMTSPAQINSADVRIDDTIGKKDTIFGRYSIMHQHRQDPPWTSNYVAGNGGFATDYVIHNQGLALGWTHTFSSTAVNQARYGFLRDNAHSNPIGVTLGTSAAADYGLTGIPASPFTAGLPPIYISNFVTLGTDRFRPQFQVSQVFQFIDNFTKLMGAHSLMFGYQYHRNTR